MSRTEKCAMCDGKGWIKDAPGLGNVYNKMKCPSCNGAGVKIIY